MTLSVVWFKRDLRITDHLPLAEAASRGSVLPVYVIETDYWEQPDTSLRHWQFVRECLLELNDQLNRLGQPLWVASGTIESVLEELLEVYGSFQLYSHQESGNLWMRERDQRVDAWCRRNEILWQQFQVDGLSEDTTQGRTVWTQQWQSYMAEANVPAPARLPFVTISPLRPEIWPDKLGADATPCPQRQPGGRRSGMELLGSFLKQRGQHYRQEVDEVLDPISASRLSPHLAAGTLSLREVVKQARRAHQHYKSRGQEEWAASLTTFVSQLLRRSHYLQMTADEPELEQRCLHAAYEGLYPSAPDKEKLMAWMLGRTGFPLVDASMRHLRRTGWLNQRLRGYVIAFACRYLWANWREPALYLARMSTDYDPALLYPLVQANAGTTGLHPWRFEDPGTLAQKLDPDGDFIRAECPELAEVEGQDVFRPCDLSEAQQVMSSCVLGADYPKPLVDLAQAVDHARQRLREHLQQHYQAEETARIVNRHSHPVLDQGLPVLSLKGKYELQPYLVSQLGRQADS